MVRLLAHGPWWSEWHHLLPFIPALGPAVAVAVAWFRGRRSR